LIEALAPEGTREAGRPSRRGRHPGRMGSRGARVRGRPRGRRHGLRMAESQGPVDGVLEAVGVKAVEWRVDPCDPPLSIFKRRMGAEGEGDSTLELAFSPGGRAVV